MKKLTILRNLSATMALRLRRPCAETESRYRPVSVPLSSRFRLVAILCLLLALGVGNAWGAVGSTITSHSNIADATVYYFAGIGSSSTTYYSVLGSDATGKQTGGANATKSNGTKYTFLIENSSYYILSPNGYYVTPAADNGKLNLSSTASAVSVSTVSNKIRISVTISNNTWSFQKNKGTAAANFGGYKNTQNDLTLHVAGYRVIYDANGATGGTVPTDATIYGDNATATIKANTGSLVKTGYTFAGWNTATNGSGTDVSASGSATRKITAGLRLYAKWTAAASCDNVPTVTAGSLKGSVTSSSSATVQCTSGISNIGGSGCSLTSYGFAVGTSSNPTIGGTLTGTGKTYEVGTSIAASTSFEKLIDGLQANTTYHVRSYATNGAGTGYGDDFTFKTLAACTAAPTVAAGSKGTITSTSAVLNCSSGISVLGTGGCAIESYGFVMNTTGTPTISDTKYEVGTTYTTIGTSFTKTVSSGLTEGTLYYVRPYATNGYNTGYGDQVSFGTPKITVSTTSLAFGDKAVNSTGNTMTFTVEGVYLQSNISIAKSGTNQAMFSIDNATVTQTSGTAPSTTITVSYSPTGAGDHSATLTLSSTNATSKTVSLSGTGKYKITWMVNGSENSTSLVASGGNPAFPAAPSSCDNTKVFVGWTETNIGSSPTDEAPTFITTATTISANKTYYAVFGKRGDFTRVTGPSSLAAGQELVIVSDKFNTAITTGIGYATAPTESSSKVSPTEAMIWLLTGNSSSGWRITKPGDGYLLGVGNLPGNNSSNTATLSANNSNSTWKIGQSSYTSNVLYISNWTTNTCALEASSSSANWVVYNSTSYNSNAYCALKVYASMLSKFVTQCCTPYNITRTGSPAGTVTGGTFTVDKTSACEGATVTLDATPSSKLYVFNAWTIKDGSANDVTTTVLGAGHAGDNPATMTMTGYAVTVTAAFSAISSIAVKTAPTKTTYCAGENFDPTGLVITATYANSATQDISYASDPTLFTFSPATNTALAANNSSVSITVGGQSTSQAITVNALRTITLTGSGTVTGGTFEADNSSACAGATITLTPHAADHFTFTSWTITKAGGGTVTPAGNTFMMPDDNVTVNATFTEGTYHYATFMNNLEVVSGYDHVKTYDGTRPTPPTLTSSNACDQSECNQFYGWVADGSEWDDTTEDLSGKVIYRSAGSLPNISGADVVYHAVWAKGSAAPAVTTPTPIVAWNKNTLGISASTNYSADLGTGTLTSTIGMSGTTYAFVNTNSGISTAPVITLSGLNLSGASTSTVNLSFYTRGSSNSAGTLTVEYSTNNGSSYSPAGTATVENGNIIHHEITGIPKATNQIRLTHAKSSGSFSIGTFKIYEPNSGTWNFTELTSANTSGWTTTDWEGDYIITNGSTTALNGYYFEDNKCLVTVSPSEGVISLNANDAGNAFRISYSAENSGYSVQGIGGGLYLKMKDKSVDRSETAQTYYTMSYNAITYILEVLQWNDTKFGFYTNSYTALKLYKTLSTYTKWRVSCCVKHNVNLYNSGSVTGGTFEADKASACGDATITLSVTNTSSGYNFDHWTVIGDVSADNIAVSNDNQFAMPADEAVTVTAVFATAHTTTVTLDAQGGTGGTANVTATVNLPMPAAVMPTYAGYTFAGYYSAPMGSGTQYYAADGSSAHVWDNSEDDTETLYAKWTSNGYTVTLNKEGATTQGTASVSVTYGTNTNLTSPIDCPTYTNKVFGGYWTTASGEGTQLIDGDGNWIPSVTGYTGVNKQWLYANNIELHARWTNVSYTNYRTTCGPEIEVTVSGSVQLTTYANCEVLTPSTALITVHSDNWKSTVGAVKYLNFRFKDKVSGVTYSHTNSTISSSEFRIYNADGNGGSYADVGYNEIPAGTTSATYSFRVAYKPTAGVYNTSDHYILEVEAMDNSATKKTITLETLDLYGRTLPEQFAIAIKKDGQWYALPNDLESTEAAAKAAQAIPIEVDDATSPTCALYAPENVLYKGAQYYGSNDEITKANRNRSGLRFTRDGSQWLQISTVEATNLMWLSTTGGTNVQDWYLNSTDFSAYTLKIDPRAGSTGYLAKTFGMFGSHFGFYATPTESEVHFLPVEHVLTEADVMEWGKNSVVLEVAATSYSKVIARVGNVATKPLTFAQTKTSGGLNSKYTWTVNIGNTIDLTTKAGDILYLDWLNSDGDVTAVSMAYIPRLIDGSQTMTSISTTKNDWKKYDVIVLPGATLDANVGSFDGEKKVTVSKMEVYPGATLKVSSGELTTTNLTLRYGWTRANSKEFNVARVYVPTTGTLKHTSAYADWYIDYDQYYPMAVPFWVTTSKIAYGNTRAASNLGTNIVIKDYDGEGRATSVQSNIGHNWKPIDPAVTTKLNPGKAYAMTAKRPNGKAFAIVRMPMEFADDWTTSGEQANVSTTYKNKVGITAYPSSEWYAMGWNFISNPYMAVFNGSDDGLTGVIETQSGTSYKYATIPNLQFSEYYQVPIAGSDLKPASGFFIQAAETGDVVFVTTGQKNSMPVLRSIALEKDNEAYIELQGASGKDMMGLIVGKDYTEAYEPNADLSKIMGDGNSLKTYMRYGEMDMAYVAINEMLAKNWIPVIVRIPEDGEYTFSMSNISSIEDLEGVYLIDYANNEQVTNLIDANYTFTAEAGTISDRFAINAIVGERETPTGVDAVNSGLIDSDKPIKFLYHEKVYILYHGVIYDAVGKRVKTINK